MEIGDDHYHCTRIQTMDLTQKDDTAFPPEQAITPHEQLSGSMLNRQHNDPFAPREGKKLVWKNVSMTLVRVENAWHVSRMDPIISYCYL